jgi:hypothetical protein
MIPAHADTYPTGTIAIADKFLGVVSINGRPFGAVMSMSGFIKGQPIQGKVFSSLEELFAPGGFSFDFTWDALAAESNRLASEVIKDLAL